MLEVPAFIGTLLGMHYGADKTTRDAKSQALIILICMAGVIIAGIAIMTFKGLGMLESMWAQGTVSAMGAASMVAIVVAAYLAMDAPDVFQVTGTVAAEPEGHVDPLRNALIAQMVALFFLSGICSMYVANSSLVSAIGSVYALYLAAVIVRKGHYASQYRNLLIFGVLVTAVLFHTLRGNFAAYTPLGLGPARKFLKDYGLGATEPMLEGVEQAAAFPVEPMLEGMEQAAAFAVEPSTFSKALNTAKHFIPLA